MSHSTVTEPGQRDLICAPEERYRWAVFRGETQGGDWIFELDHAEFGSRKAHTKQNMSLQLAKGARVELFLIRLTGGSNWIAELWTRQINPWINGRIPKLSTVVEATVARLVKRARRSPSTGFGLEDFAVAEVDIDTVSVDVMVPKTSLPADHALAIDEILKIGDRVRGVVDDLDAQRLRIRVNVASCLLQSRELAQQKNAQKQFELAGPKTNLARAPAERATLALAPYRILVIDNDARLRRMLGRWLGKLGATTKTTSDLGAVQDVISSFSPTHILVDFGLNEPGDFDRIAPALASSRAFVAIFTGRPDDAEEKARALGFGLVGKPVNSAQLHAWLKEPATYTNHSKGPQRRKTSHWSVEVQTDSIVKEASAVLERLCKRYQCAGAFWVVEERDTVFELRANTDALSGGVLTGLVGELSQSMVQTCLFTRELVCRRISRNDPAHAVALALGLSDPYFVALPIIKASLRPRIVVFLHEGAVPEETIARIVSRTDHFELLIRAVQQAEHVDHVEAFATQGRLASGAVHEVRNALQTLGPLKADIEEALEKQDFENVKESIGELFQDLTKVQDIVTAGLEFVRAERRALTNVDNTTRRIVQSMQDVALDVHHKDNVMVRFEPSMTQLATAIPPAPLEQALINLLENAIGFLPNERWATIIVKASIDVTDEVTPIHIDVIDNGPGLNADDRSRLFEPRRTVKGRAGNGLGLFVSRNLVRSAGGELALIDTIRWCGAHFRISLPAVFNTMDE